MEVAPAAEFEARPQFRAKRQQVLLGLHRLGLRLVVAAGNQFLADVGWVADNGVELGQGDGSVPPFPAQALGQFAKGLTGADLEKIAAGDAGVVLLVVNLAGGKVERGQMGGEE